MIKLTRKLPDGGWGWMVVFGAALANMANQAIVSIFSLVYGEAILKTSYGIAGVALVLNINSMVTNFSGVLTGPILKNFAPRWVTCVGVFLTASGLILSSMVTTIWGFICTFSIFAGLGLGLIQPASFIAINSYFDKRKGQAVGLAMAGTGLGQTFMPQVVTLLQEAYAFKGTVLILGAISLQGLVGALLFQPVERHLRKVAAPEDEVTVSNNNTKATRESEQIALLRPQSDSHTMPKSYGHTQFHDATNNNSTIGAMPKKGGGGGNGEGGGKISSLKRIASALDLHLLGDATFVHIIIGLSVVYASSIAFSVLFPFHLAYAGLGRAETAWCMSMLSAADIAARLTVPRLARRARIGYRMTFLVGAIALAVCRSVLAVQTRFETMLAASALCGYARAATVINQSLTVAEYCEDGGRGPLASALGLNMVSKGIFVLTLGQFFAWARAPGGGYVLCILIQSAFLAAVALSWAGEMLVRRRRRQHYGKSLPSS